MFELDQKRQKTVFDRLRQGILAGTFAPGTRLPPTRALAEELGTARLTIVLAYERLAVEGYVRARQGSGTYVSEDLPEAVPGWDAEPTSDAGSAPSRAETAIVSLSARGAALALIPSSAVPADALDGMLLSAGVPAADLFPTAAWVRATGRALKTMNNELAGYPPPQGLLELRVQIARHLAATRGLIADPSCIVITSGTQQALHMAAQLLLDPGASAWVENPGYISGRAALVAAGVIPIAVPSDREGLDVAAGIRLAPDARLVLVAPSHATPLGGALPVGRRLALLEWAARGGDSGAGAWLLEDDCDSEFRWEGHPLPPLATLDRAGRVIYCGTFSKTLSPALRLGFMVVPAPLVAAFVRLHALMDRGTGTMTQAVLAQFMKEGRLAPHIRRMRTEYARRRTALLDAMARHAPALTPVRAPGGLHLVTMLPAGADEAAMVRACRARDLGVAPLSAYYVDPAQDTGTIGLVMGFAGLPTAMAADAVRRLGALLTQISQAAP